MKVAVTGSSGLMGRVLVPALVERGHDVIRLVRSEPSGPDEAGWSPAEGRIDLDRLAGIDAAVNLAGEPIGNRRWTRTQKAKILDSRVRGTRLLAETMTHLQPRPRALVNASAMGFYGDRGDEILTEASSQGAGFLASVVRMWEDAATPALDAGIRVCFSRTGLVLTPRGGLLKRVLLPFRLGMGGRLASGRQWMSWVSLEDQVGAMLHLLEDRSASGPYNVAAPNPVRNDEFTRVLARVLRRPAVIPIPKALIAIPYGRELADDLLASIRIVSKRLADAGYLFADGELEPTLRAMLGR
ncbi:MAG: TIGR01777 family oxidoreductase [Actinomycetota bacterium]